eukprot:evm.model.scf_344.2 EVM.evm.TU.scf_344.2   scf_344:23588-28295(-)
MGAVGGRSAPQALACAQGAPMRGGVEANCSAAGGRGSPRLPGQRSHRHPTRREECLMLGTLSLSGLLAGNGWCLDAPSLSANDTTPDVTVTDKVYFDVGICPGPMRSDRTLGDKSVLCTEAAPIGRLVIGLYGHLAPTTVTNFLRTVRSGSYTSTVFHKVRPGQYIQAGRQGSRRMGAVEAPDNLQYNPEVTSARAFALDHVRPGVVSLSVYENDDEPSIRDRKNYHNTEFLITTGPGPAPQLDGQNLVFGQVLEGIDAVVTASEVPVFNPSSKVKALNAIAGAVGDERAVRARRSWGTPLKAVVILDSGVLS